MGSQLAGSGCVAEAPLQLMQSKIMQLQRPPVRVRVATVSLETTHCGYGRTGCVAGRWARCHPT